jgi:hypothetical protein
MLSLSQDEYLNARGYCALAHTECLRGEIVKARQSFVAGLQNM